LTSGVKIEFCHGAPFPLRATFSILIEYPTIPLTIDSKRLGASAIDGIWLRARVRNGGVGHSAGAWCAAPRGIATVHVGNDGLDAIWALVLEGDC